MAEEIWARQDVFALWSIPVGAEYLRVVHEDDGPPHAKYQLGIRKEDGNVLWMDTPLARQWLFSTGGGPPDRCPRCDHA